MIIENTVFESGEIITFKLITGEEVIAKFISFDDSVLKVSKPLVIVVMQEGMAFMQYLIGCDTDEMSFYKESLMNVPNHTTSSLADIYIEKVSNIQIYRG